MDVNPFLKRLMKDETEEVVHSSAYAKAQNAEGFGVTSAESFTERREIDKGRTFIRKYGESRVANRPMGVGRMEGSQGVVRGQSGSVGAQGGLAGPQGGMKQPPARRNPGISR